MRNFLILMALVIVASSFLPGCATKRVEQKPQESVIVTSPELGENSALQKGWFDEYDKKIIEEVSTKTHLLKWNGSPVYWTKFLHALAASE